MSWNLGIAAAQNLQYQTFHAVCVESMPQGDHLVEDAAEGPDVGLLVVGLLLIS